MAQLSTQGAASEAYENGLFFDIQDRELLEYEAEKLQSRSEAPLFRPSSSPEATRPGSEAEDIDWVPSEEEGPPAAPRVSSKARTKSAPPSVITISDSEDEENAAPPPKKRKQTPPTSRAASPSAEHCSEPAQSLDCAELYIGDLVIEAWSTVKGKGHIRPGELLCLERDALPGKTSSKSASNTIATITAAAKKKVTEDTIVRVVNSRAIEVGRVVTASGRWIAKLLDKNLVRLLGKPLNVPAEFKHTGDTFKITLKAYFTPPAFHPISATPRSNTKYKAAVNKTLDKHLNALKKTTIMFEGAESAEERAFRERKTSLVTLFEQLGLKPKRSGFSDFAKKGGKEKAKKPKPKEPIEDIATAKSGAAQRKGKNIETIGEGEEAEEAELEGEELNNNQLGDIYQKAQRDDKQLAFMTPSDSFALDLRPYQQQALHWMWNIERGDVSSRDSSSLHPLWEEYLFPYDDSDGVIDLCADERSFYFNPYSGELSLDFVKTENHGKGGILADVGMGKSIMMSSLIHTSRGRPPTLPTNAPKNDLLAAFGKRKRVAEEHVMEPHATLLVAPISLLAQWQSELEKCSKPDTLRTLIWHGLNRANLTEVLGPQPADERPVDVVITSYGTLSSEFANTEKGRSSQIYDVRWMRVVLDEAHYCKSRHTKNAKACYKLNSVYRWALTGTPIVNRLEDLYSLLCFLNFVTTPFLNRDPRAVEIIQVILENVLLRREKNMQDVDGNQIVELPPKIMSIEELTFSPTERRTYDEIYMTAKQDFGDLDGTGTVTKNLGHMFAQLMRLRQAVLHPDLIKAPREDLEEETITAGDSEDDSHRNPQPSSSIQIPGCGNCPVCFEEINVPVIVRSCGHTGCEKCFENFFALCREKDDVVVCPVCRLAIEQDPPYEALTGALIPMKEENVEATSNPTARLSSRNETASQKEFKSSTKVDALLRNLNELREQDPAFRAIVFSQFTSFLGIIQKALDHHGFENMRLDGTMSQQQRSHSVASFTSPGSSPKVFCISLRAGGVGLNLTQAQYVFMMDFWWNRAAENQAIDRIHRIGQTRTVYVKHFVVKNTIEKRVLQIQKRKTAIVQGAFGKAGEKGTKESVQNMKLMFGD